MTKVSLLLETRRMIGNPTAHAVPDYVLTPYLDEGQEALNRRVGWNYTDSSADVTIVNGTQEYTLPTDVVEILWVEHNDLFLARSDQDEYLRRGIQWRSTTAATPTEYYHYGGKIGLYPKPNAAAVSADSTLTIRYRATPATVPTNGPAHLPTQDHRVLCYYAAARYLQNKGELDRAKGLFDVFNMEAEIIAAQFKGRKVSR